VSDKTIYAATHGYTPGAESNERVPYVNLSERDGKLVLTVRSRGQIDYCRVCQHEKPSSARIELSRLELADLAKAILAHLGAGADLRAQLDLRLQEMLPELCVVTDVQVKGEDNDFPLGQACDLSGEGGCEACQ
jgi:hypothetical protein